MIKQFTYNIGKQAEEQIDAFIQRVSPESVFHKTVCYALYSKTKKYTPIYFVSYNNEEINGVLLVTIIRSYPVGRFGKRALVMQMPVVESENKIVCQELLNEMVRHVGKSVFYIEIRNASQVSPYNAILNSTGFKSQERLSIILDFDSTEVFKSLSESKQRQINKGLSGGATIEKFESIYELRTFYGILKELYNTKVKKPLPHRTFFEKAYRLSKQGEEIQLIAIKYYGMVIGGMLMIGSPGSTYYEWYIGGLHEEYKPFYPSVLATWGGIVKAHKSKAKRFDFLGGGIPGVPYGVRDFKARFGSSEQLTYRWQWSMNPSLFRLAQKLFLNRHRELTNKTENE